MGVQKHNEKSFAKKIVSKSFHKKFDNKNPKPIFLDFLLSRSWAFLGEGVQKHNNKYHQKSDPGPFFDTRAFRCEVLLSLHFAALASQD
jgi:hypothetical protein